MLNVIQMLLVKVFNARHPDDCESCFYLIPWPGPQAKFLIWISEEFPTIDMQSSPGYRILRIKLRWKYNR